MLTDAAIKQALRARQNRTLTDGTGRGSGRLVLNIRNMPKRTLAEWYAQQWLNGRRRTRKLGTYPELSLGEARAKFSEIAPTISERIDIRASKREHMGTVADLFEAYEAWQVQQGRKAVYKLPCFYGPIVELLGDKPANSVRTEDIIEVLRPIYTRGSKAMADSVRAVAHAAFAWALRSEADYRMATPRRFGLSSNPAAAIPSAPPKPGNRWLSVDELRAFWRYLDREATPNYLALKLLVLTGQRAGEIMRLRPDMISEDVAYWETTKNGLPHALPLPAQALDILSRCSVEDGWYFYSFGRGHGFAHPRALWRLIVTFCNSREAEPFNVRDLRRTWKTLAGEAGLSKEVRDLLQNHSKSDVSARHYDRYAYMSEKRDAMRVWSEWFKATIEA